MNELIISTSHGPVLVIDLDASYVNYETPIVNLEVRSEAMSDKEPELKIDLDASYIPNRWTPTMNPEMRSEAMIEQDGAQQWKLEAQRLAELVEAQRQVIITLRKEKERLVMQIAGNAYRPPYSGLPNPLGS